MFTRGVTIRPASAAIALLILINGLLWLTLVSRQAPQPSSAGVNPGGPVGTTTAAATEPASTSEASPSHTTTSKPAPNTATTPSPPTSTSTATPTPTRRSIRLTPLSSSAQPFETVRYEGSFFGTGNRTTLRVQVQQSDGWLSFPLPTKTDRSGSFSAYVEVGRPGRYRLRAIDPETKAVSNVVVLSIR